MFDNRKQTVLRTKKNKSTASETVRRRLAVVVMTYAVLLILTWQQSLPAWLMLWYVSVGIITYFIYASDKQAARKNSRRVPEQRLHVLAVLGGWPAAMAAQQLLPHKRRKMAFMQVFYVCAWINLALLTLWLIGQDTLIWLNSR